MGRGSSGTKQSKRVSGGTRASFAQRLERAVNDRDIAAIQKIQADIIQSGAANREGEEGEIARTLLRGIADFNISRAANQRQAEDAAIEALARGTYTIQVKEAVRIGITAKSRAAVRATRRALFTTQTGVDRIDAEIPKRRRAILKNATPAERRAYRRLSKGGGS